MTRAVLLAAAAGVAGVAGTWELLAAIERARAGAWLAAALRPLRQAGALGRAPSAAERRRLAVLATVCLLAAGWLLAGPLAGGLAALTGPAGVAAIVRRRRRGYRARLAAGAAPAARALAAALAAGRSVRVAVAEAGGSLAGPAGHELRVTAAALEAGEPTEPALDGLRRRAGSRAWDALIAAVGLHREAGGDLPGLLRELAAALEATRRGEADARAMIAQSRFTAQLVAGLPVGALVLAELADPGFAAGLVGNPLSAVLVATAAGLQLTALLVVGLLVSRLGDP